MCSSDLTSPTVRAIVRESVTQAFKATELQLELEGIVEKPDLDTIISKTTELMIDRTIDIPRIILIPNGEVRSGFHPFTLNLDSINYQAPSTDLWIQTLRTQETEILGLNSQGIQENRLEDYIVSGLIDFDDIAYDEQANLLYDLAHQVVEHFQTYLEDEEIRKVLQVYQRSIADLIHAQMQIGRASWRERVLMPV